MGLTQTLVLAAESWVVAFSVDRRGFAGAIDPLLERCRPDAAVGISLQAALFAQPFHGLQPPLQDVPRRNLGDNEYGPAPTADALTLQPSLSNVPLCDLGRNACTQCCAPARRNVWWCPPSQLGAGTPTDWRGSQHVLFALWRDVRCDDRRLALGSEVLCGESDGVRRRVTACDGVRRHATACDGVRRAS